MYASVHADPGDIHSGMRWVIPGRKNLQDAVAW